MDQFLASHPSNWEQLGAGSAATPQSPSSAPDAYVLIKTGRVSMSAQLVFITWAHWYIQSSPMITSADLLMQSAVKYWNNILLFYRNTRDYRPMTNQLSGCVWGTGEEECLVTGCRNPIGKKQRRWFELLTNVYLLISLTHTRELWSSLERRETALTQVKSRQ